MSGEFNIYTMANDTMLSYLKTFCNSLISRDSSLIGNLFVIPFNENFDDTRRYCESIGAGIVEPDSSWDFIGDTIYGEEEYRAGVRAKNYFRKLNCFSHSKRKFVFFDVNSIVIGDFERAMSCLGRSIFEILFMSRSAPGRTLRNESFEVFVNKLNPNLKSGFNAGFFASYPGVIDKGKAISIANPRLRRLFGKAPEQAFISYYVAVFDVAAEKIGDIDPSIQKGFWPNKFKVVKHRGLYYYDDNGHVDRPLFVVKWTGQSMAGSKDTLNFDLLSQFI